MKRNFVLYLVRQERQHSFFGFCSTAQNAGRVNFTTRSSICGNICAPLYISFSLASRRKLPMCFGKAKIISQYRPQLLCVGGNRFGGNGYRTKQYAPNSSNFIPTRGLTDSCLIYTITQPGFVT